MKKNEKNNSSSGHTYKLEFSAVVVVAIIVYFNISNSSLCRLISILYCRLYTVIEYISTYYCTMSHKSAIFFKEFFFLKKKIRFYRLCFVQLLWAHMYFLSFLHYLYPLLAHCNIL